MYKLNCQLFDIYFILKVSAVLEEVVLSCITSLVILNIDAKIFLFVFIYQFLISLIVSLIRNNLILKEKH